MVLFAAVVLVAEGAGTLRTVGVALTRTAVMAARAFATRIVKGEKWLNVL